MSYAYTTAGPDVSDANGERVALWRVDVATQEREPLLADGSLARPPVTGPSDPVEPIVNWVLAGNGEHPWRR